jgi:hypothetical protein
LRAGELRIDRRVALARIVVDEIEGAHARSPRQLGDLAHRRMAPVHVLGVLLVGVGAVGDERVGVAAELGEPFDVLVRSERRVGRVELIVGDIAEPAPRVLEPVAETVAGMAQQHRVHPDAADLVLALDEIAVLHVGGELARGDRKEHAVHLGRDEAAHVDVAMRGPADLEGVALHVERTEERQRVDVVPVRMRDQHARVQPRAPTGHERIRQRADARAGVEHEQSPVREVDADAERVAAIAPRVRARHRQRPAHPPEAHGERARHQAFDVARERRGRQRLDEVRVGAHLERPAALERERLRRHDNEPRVVELGHGPQTPAQLVAVDARHHQIEDHAVGPHARDASERFLAVRANHGGVTALFEQRPRDLRLCAAVVHHVHGEFARHGGPPAAVMVGERPGAVKPDEGLA